MPKGLIVKALSGFYYVEDNDSKKVYECRSRGVFRNINISPLVGDRVTFQFDENEKGLITEVDKRTNELVRPQIANVDQVLLVFSVKKPDFNQPLLDRFLAIIECFNVKPIIVLTKTDLLNGDEVDKYINYYQSIGYKIIKTSKFDEKSIAEFCLALENKISVLAGQSGVGKSSILNAINPEFQLVTDEISKALGRGKHTTRHVELFKVADGLLADTPGFSSLDFSDFNIDVNQLSQAFIDYFKLSENCKFRCCTHINEPGCAVKARLKENEVYDNRYGNYKNFIDEILNQRVVYVKKKKGEA